MSTPEAKLSPKQDAAIVALITCRTIKEAAEKIEVGESTMIRWLATRDFRDRYEAERRQILEAAKNALRSAATESVETLLRVQRAGDATASAKVTAARAVLDLCMRVEENDDILLRLQRLEEATGGNDEE